MHSFNKPLTAPNDRDNTFTISSPLNVISSGDREDAMDESQDIHKKCYLLRKLLAHQIKPGLNSLPMTRTIPRLKPFRSFGSILDKTLPCTELFSHPNPVTSKTTSNASSSKFHILGPTTSANQDIPYTTNQATNCSRGDERINIFGAMAVSFKADFLQSCAAALLRRRVSIIRGYYVEVTNRSLIQSIKVIVRIMYENEIQILKIVI